MSFEDEVLTAEDIRHQRMLARAATATMVVNVKLQDDPHEQMARFVSRTELRPKLRPEPTYGQQYIDKKKVREQRELLIQRVCIFTTALVLLAAVIAVFY